MTTGKPDKRKVTKPAFTTATDGVDHINLHMEGKTEVGRMLAHFYYAPFVHPHYGLFYCLEGLWHWLRLKDKDDALRKCAGAKAKKYAQGLDTVYCKNFQEIILEANYFKIMNNPKIKAAVIESTLPFDNYYLWGPANLQIRPKESAWLSQGMEEVRRLIKEGLPYPTVEYPPIS